MMVTLYIQSKDNLISHYLLVTIFNISIDLNFPPLLRLILTNEKIKTSGNNNTKAAYAIDAKNIKMLKYVGFDTHNKVISIISKSKHKDKAALALEWLLNGK